jgi:hypothetical protein
MWLNRECVGVLEMLKNVRFTTERRLRIPFVRLFTMSKNRRPYGTEPLGVWREEPANRFEASRSPLASGGRFLRVGSDRVKRLFSKK